MAFANNVDKKDNAPKSLIGLLSILIPCLTTLLSAFSTDYVNLRIEQMKEEHETKMLDIKNTNIYHFYSEAEFVEQFDMKFVKYKIKAEPCVKGFHVIMYPYIVCENKENTIIPVEGQFMQDEYVADEAGSCTLFRENTTDDLIQTVQDMMNFSVDVKCLVAIKYVENNEEKIKLFDLKDGQLTESKKDTVISVLQAWQKEDSTKIDVRSWPDYNENSLKNIIS